MSKILYIEDNEDNVFMLATRLRRKGFEVVIARDGIEGINVAHAENPDLILMDLSLPVLDGWEAMRRLKASPETQSIPIIVLTAHAMAGDREKAVAVGADEYDTKPVRLPDLLAKTETFLGTTALT